jgi:hypothetical protein
MKRLLTLLTLTLITAPGCGVSEPIGGRADPYVPRQINIAERDLRDKTAIGDVRTRRENGILYVTVPIRSASNYNLHVDKKITFKDSQGNTIYESGWENHPTLIHNIFQEIRFNSTSADAADFQLDLRYAR